MIAALLFMSSTSLGPVLDPLTGEPCPTPQVYKLSPLPGEYRSIPPMTVDQVLNTRPDMIPRCAERRRAMLAAEARKRRSRR
jgi:hypothetical protein